MTQSESINSLKAPPALMEVPGPGIRQAGAVGAVLAVWSSGGC